jgi:hypothetical protein
MSTDSVLSQYYRQPEIYITLPSGGQFYPEGTLEITATGEIPIYPMTAKDDIIVKTPDALISGEAIAQIIASCVPSIKDPWAMPASDIDYILIAIRIASYGNEMDMDLTCINDECLHEFAMAVGLSDYVEKLGSVEFNNEQTTIQYGEIKVHIKPLSYLDTSLMQRRTFEEQQAVNVAANAELTQEERESMYNDILRNMTDINMISITSGVQGIELPTGEIVVDKDEIVEFVNNSSVKLFRKITTCLEDIRAKTELPNITAECPECKSMIDIPLIFDYANFFA